MAKILEMYVDQIEVTTIGPDMIPDPAWIERDDHGHEHRWIDGKLPTLRVESIDSWNGEEEYTDTYWYCLQCGDEISPQWKIDPKWTPGMRRFIPGLHHFLIDGREVSRDEFAIEYTAQTGNTLF